VAPPLVVPPLLAPLLVAANPHLCLPLAPAPLHVRSFSATGGSLAMGLWGRGSNNGGAWSAGLPAPRGGAVHARGVRLLDCLQRRTGRAIKSRK
jgi:hypothetical protein